jgi:hypothetical protein
LTEKKKLHQIRLQITTDRSLLTLPMEKVEKTEQTEILQSLSKTTFPVHLLKSTLFQIYDYPNEAVII